MPVDTQADLVKPTFESVPPRHSTFGQDAVDLAASAGLVLDPWQAYSLHQILGEDETGRPAAFEAALIVPRQNGKGSVLEALSLAWLFLTDAPLILHSAHEFKTAAEGFRRLRTLIMNAPHLAAMVERVTTAAGNEAIELTTGQRLRYVARSKGSGRGFSADKVILDEAYALADDEMAALLPTMATRPEAQLVYTSSAGMESSSHLRMVRDRGRRGGDPSLCYLEWGGVAECPDRCTHALDAPGCGFDDPAAWLAANPGLGPRISADFVAKERRAMPPEAFGRERLGLWDEALGGDVPIPPADWAACSDVMSEIVGRPVFAIAVSRDGRSSVIAAAGWREDGLPHVEITGGEDFSDYRSGTDWVVERAVELKKHRPLCWVVDKKTAAASLLPDLKAAGIKPREMNTNDCGQACSGLQNAVRDRRLRHLGDDVLTASVAGAARRDIGDGLWAWSAKTSEVDVVSLIAVTNALWGLSVTPKPRPLVAFK